MENETIESAEAADSGGIFSWLGERVGQISRRTAGSIADFFGGVGEGAGVSGFIDWAALLIGLAMILSSAKGLKGGKIVGPILGGAIGGALMGWAIS